MNILIVDDEQLARERLLRLVDKLLPQASCEQAADGSTALSLLGQREYDLMLLDIRMPGMDGLEVAAKVSDMPQPPAIIFCTAYDEYALQALQQQAVGYVLKPVREQQLSTALASASRVNRMQLASLHGPQPGPRQVSSQTHRGVETMPLEQVRCFIAEHKYVTAVGVERELVLQNSLRELEQEFPREFVRVHRNALVALAHVQRLLRADDGSWQAELAGVDISPTVSRRHLAAIKQALVNR